MQVYNCYKQFNTAKLLTKPSMIDNTQYLDQ